MRIRVAFTQEPILWTLLELIYKNEPSIIKRKYDFLTYSIFKVHNLEDQYTEWINTLRLRMDGEIQMREDSSMLFLNAVLILFILFCIQYKIS